MRKLNKLDLSGVEHLSDQDAKEYLADSASSDCIREADGLNKSGSEGESGGQLPGTGITPTDAECDGRKEGDSCSFAGQAGVCVYHKVPLPAFPFDGEQVKLVCGVPGNPESGTELSAREHACVGAKYGDPCSWDNTLGTMSSGKCFYEDLGLGRGILYCKGFASKDGSEED